MFVGSWLFEGLEVVKYVRDATPVAPPEPIVELGSVSGDVLRQLLSRLRQLISLASVVAWIKRVGLRVFIHGSAIPEPMNDFIRAALAGGADGVFVDDIVNVNSDLIDTVHVNQRVSENSVNYIVISLICLISIQLGHTASSLRMPSSTGTGYYALRICLGRSMVIKSS